MTMTNRASRRRCAAAKDLAVPVVVRYYARDGGSHVGLAIDARRRRGTEQIQMIVLPPRVRWIPRDLVGGEVQHKGKPYPVRRAVRHMLKMIKTYTAAGVAVPASARKSLNQVLRLGAASTNNKPRGTAK